MFSFYAYGMENLPPIKRGTSSNQGGFFFLTDQLERVFLRLGHAETDEQLQDIISKFLPPVLLKLSSVQEGVRKKVRWVLLSHCLDILK